MNHFVGIGRLTRDPEVRYTQSGKACAKFTLAAEVISQYCTKGEKIAVEGRIQTRSYEKDGRKNYVTEVVVQSMEFCDSKGGQQLSDAKEFGGATVPDEDIPF